MYNMDTKYLSRTLRIPKKLCEGMSENVIIFQADNGNHFTHYGVFEGTYLFVDLEKEYLPGHLSCYAKHEDGRPPFIKLSDVPLDGFEHIGRVVLTLRNHEIVDNEVITDGQS